MRMRRRDEAGGPVVRLSDPPAARRLAAPGRDVALLVGGANGLDPSCLGRADQRWSLSPLTLSHVLVRGILAEPIYRAQSLLDGHPYHRG